MYFYFVVLGGIALPEGDLRPMILDDMILIIQDVTKIHISLSCLFAEDPFSRTLARKEMRARLRVTNLPESMEVFASFQKSGCK